MWTGTAQDLIGIGEHIPPTLERLAAPLKPVPLSVLEQLRDTFVAYLKQLEVLSLFMCSLASH